MERYRIFSDGAVYFVTFSVVDWLPVFISERACRIVTESFDYCHNHKGLRLNAYVIMPTHLHAIVFRETFDPEALKATLTDFRKFTARTLIEHCASCLPACYDRVFLERAGKDRRRTFWQPTIHPEQIETEAFWRQKLDYLHDNPCRKGLVDRAEHWRFSSARHFFSDHPVASEVILSAIDW
jgi:REP-associated tyrosine transposase